MELDVVEKRRATRQKGASLSARVKLGLGAFGIVILILLICLDPFFAGRAYNLDPMNMLVSPMGHAHILGTDDLGRDLFSRLILGLGLSLLISIGAVVLSVILGSCVGFISGYTRREWLDAVLMRITDVQLAFPFIVLAIAVLTVVRPNVLIITLVLTLVNWPVYARVVRSFILREKNRDYVKAAKVLGASQRRIVTKYIAPNFLASIIAISTLDIATMIVYEAVLDFLGLGIQPPTPSLGNIMAEGRDYIQSAWWIITLPGVFILFITISINLFVEGWLEKSGRNI